MIDVRCPIPASAPFSGIGSQRRWLGAVATVLILFAGSTVNAQKPSTPPKATFHLPAGDYSVTELLDQAELALRRRIVRPGNLAGNYRLHLQTALELHDEGWQDVLGAMLWSRDLVLGQRGDGDYEVFATPVGNMVEPVLQSETDRIVEIAKDCTLSALYDRWPYGPVRVTVPHMPVAHIDCVHKMLAHTGRPCQAVAAARGAVTIAGIGYDVRRAMRFFAGNPGNLSALGPPAAPWPRDGGEQRVELQQGERTARDLIDLLARELHRNVLVEVDADYLETRIEIETTRRFDVLQLEEEITRLLWDSKIALLVPLAPSHGLYEARGITNGEGAEEARKSLETPMSAAEIRSRPDLATIVSVRVKIRHLPLGVAREVMGLAHFQQPPRGQSREQMVFFTWGSDHEMHLRGTPLALVGVLDKLAEKDVPPVAEQEAPAGNRGR